MDDPLDRSASTGAKPVFAVLALPAYEIKDSWLNSRSVDDLLGCAVSLEAVRPLSVARAKTNVTVLLNRAEEVGFIGALDMIASGVLTVGDSYLSIESSRELPGSKPGGGPTIRLGDRACAFDANLVALLDEAGDNLRRRGTKVQRLRLTGGTCEATAYLTFGLEAAGVAVPLVNYHNGWGADAVAPERVHLSDVEGAVRLLVEAARLFPAKTLRGVLRARLAKRGGDKGETGLFGGARVPKNHPRVAAYGTLDELNSALGAARAALPAAAEFGALDEGLERIQAECFVVGALLATPANKLGKLRAPFDQGLPADSATRLEKEIDAWEAELAPLKTFILPGGAVAGAALHVARAVARRAEREVVELSAREPLPDGVVVYLNRLSTWLFIAARMANKKHGKTETPWTGLSKKS